MATRTAKTTIPKKKAAPTLDSRIFDYKVNEALLSQVIHVYRANTHQNTSKVKTRGEVNRTTKKVYRQKGTGNARHGARSAPIYVGGGVAHGPSGVSPAL
ncbi:50S ribosomal protein L4, partial [Candidatus Collierbacteria bacterium]|nr:50S ribosomal protein L4 [Candidatus Collierbacteria bacterium]